MIQGYLSVSLDCIFSGISGFLFTHNLTKSLIKKKSQGLSIFVFSNITSNRKRSLQQMLEVRFSVKQKEPLNFVVLRLLEKKGSFGQTAEE